MRSWSYAAMLLFVLAATLPLDRLFGAGVLRQGRRLALAILPVAAVFLLWDAVATRAGHWAFDPDQTLGIRLRGLPVEEVGFFVVIPLAAVLTYEAVGAVGSRRRRRS